jgi:hypothetical protein
MCSCSSSVLVEEARGVPFLLKDLGALSQGDPMGARYSVALCACAYSRTSIARHTAAAMIADSLRIPSGITSSSTLLNDRRSWFRP